MTWRLCWRTWLYVSDGLLPRSERTFVSHCHRFCASPLANLVSNRARSRQALSHVWQRSNLALASLRMASSPALGRGMAQMLIQDVLCPCSVQRAGGGANFSTSTVEGRSSRTPSARYRMLSAPWLALSWTGELRQVCAASFHSRR